MPALIQNSVDRILVVSSKFFPEYSGLGYRAQTLYQRLSDIEFAEWEVLCGGVEYRSRAEFYHEGIPLTRATLGWFESVARVFGFEISTFGKKLLSCANSFFASQD